jgi:hypothetical protein
LREKLKDFTRIQSWTVDDHNAEHSTDVEWLREQIYGIRSKEDAKNGASRKIVVVTHHSPTRQGSSRPQDEANPWSDAFATDLIGPNHQITTLSNVQWWIFGHTHYTTSCRKGRVRLVSNQRGYSIRSDDKEPRPRTTLDRWMSWHHLCQGH